MVPLPAVVQSASGARTDPRGIGQRVRPGGVVTLRTLHRITSDAELELADKVRRLLELGLDTFGLDIAIVSRITGPTYRVEHSVSRLDPIAAGTAFELSNTYCAVVLASDVPHLFHRVGESEIRNHPCYREMGLESYIGAPVLVGGERYGTLNFSSPKSGSPFSHEDVDLLCLMAQWLGYELSRARHEAELATAKERAEAANRAKSGFLATVSHELRTSMNGVLGVAQLLARSELTRPQEHDIKTILSTGRAMMTLLDDLLDLSSIETGRLSLREQPFLIASVIQNCFDTMTTQADAKGLSLHVDSRAVDDLWLLGDPGRVRQIVLNLVSNAIKYTDEGSVRLTSTWRQTERGPVLALAVEDTGMGIAADDQAWLFEPFTRANSVYVRMREGKGLGLSICRQLCDMMDGRISLESEVGRGSRFYVELPLSRTDPPTLEVPVVSRHAPLVDDLPNKLSVLLAEDNLVSQKITARMLRSLGCEVTTVGTGAQAVARVQAAFDVGQAIDVVLMEWAHAGHGWL